jgi:tripartite-type tricarboxylate transporter receptor subunit TctC
MSRRLVIGYLFAVVMLMCAPLCARADDYPSRPIHLIITTPAGSLVDVLGRLYAEAMSERLGQPIVVDNRVGAMTQVGTEVLTRADPDGYTLMIGPSELTMLPFLKKNYPYNPTKDITPIALITTSWTVFAIYPGLPVKTLPEFVDYAKAAAVSAARCTSRSRCSSSRPASTSSTCPIAAASRPRPTPWPGRSKWCR